MNGLRIESVSSTGRTVVRLSGQVDVRTSARLRAELSRRFEDTSRGDRLDVDLGDVAFMDSSGLSVLIGAYKKAAGRGVRLVLVELPPAIHRMLRITGLLSVLEIEGPAPDGAHERSERHH